MFFQTSMLTHFFPNLPFGAWAFVRAQNINKSVHRATNTTFTPLHNAPNGTVKRSLRRRGSRSEANEWNGNPRMCLQQGAKAVEATQWFEFLEVNKLTFHLERWAIAERHTTHLPRHSTKEEAKENLTSSRIRSNYVIRRWKGDSRYGKNFSSFSVWSCGENVVKGENPQSKEMEECRESILKKQ